MTKPQLEEALKKSEELNQQLSDQLSEAHSVGKSVRSQLEVAQKKLVEFEHMPANMKALENRIGVLESVKVADDKTISRLEKLLSHQEAENENLSRLNKRLAEENAKAITGGGEGSGVFAGISIPSSDVLSGMGKPEISRVAKLAANRIGEIEDLNQQYLINQFLMNVVIKSGYIVSDRNGQIITVG